mmetsp:Transcript_108501/g.171226  ORF Transcript_108501/g.171226 Transcript_108501/m.171226 type:complete len:234 (-) Transcript_108501:2-703(-)
MTYTFFPVSLNFVWSKYAAAAKEDEKISSASTVSKPSPLNFPKYPFRLFVELLVTKNIFFPALRSISKTAGTPSMRESPFQITPSQSKIKTSVLSSNSEGTSSFVHIPADFMETASSGGASGAAVAVANMGRLRIHGLERADLSCKRESVFGESSRAKPNAPRLPKGAVPGCIASRYLARVSKGLLSSSFCVWTALIKQASTRTILAMFGNEVKVFRDEAANQTACFLSKLHT